MLIKLLVSEITVNRKISMKMSKGKEFFKSHFEI